MDTLAVVTATLDINSQTAMASPGIILCMGSANETTLHVCNIVPLAEPIHRMIPASQGILLLCCLMNKEILELFHSQMIFEENLCNFVFITVPTDGLVPGHL